MGSYSLQMGGLLQALQLIKQHGQMLANADLTSFGLSACRQHSIEFAAECCW